MRVVSSKCPYCKTTISNIITCEGITPCENDVVVCMLCGEFLLFGPFLTLKKCNLTPEEMSDKLGLLLYGQLLIIQETVKSVYVLKNK